MCEDWSASYDSLTVAVGDAATCQLMWEEPTNGLQAAVVAAHGAAANAGCAGGFDVDAWL